MPHTLKKPRVLKKVNLVSIRRPASLAVQVPAFGDANPRAAARQDRVNGVLRPSGVAPEGSKGFKDDPLAVGREMP